MISGRSIFRLWLALPLAMAVACGQGDDQPIAPSQFSVAAIDRSVADVEQLYAAVNDPANAGAAITLAPGTYVLSPNDAAGIGRPNRGRLELQQDMSLYGVTDDRSAVVIDATGLPATSFTALGPGRTGVIRIGRGRNTIEWLTVLGPPTAAAGIATELPGTASTRIRVAHVVSGGTSRGVDVRNVGADNAGRRLDAEIVDNELFGPALVIGNTEGIRVANLVGANGSIIDATLSDNRAHGFQVGILVVNNRSSNAVIAVRSAGDRFFGNTLGGLIGGGLSTTTLDVANANATTFEAYGSEFVGNTAALPGFEPGGIHVFGARATVQPDVASSNTVSVSLWGTKVANNLGVNFQAFGAVEDALLGTAGTNNRVTIALHGVSKQIDVLTTASLPRDPTGTNTVTVIR